MKLILYLLLGSLCCVVRSAELTSEQVIAMTLLGEARGEGEAGMYAGATVIAQRSINRKLTPRQVCLQSSLVKGRRIHQFSCWNNSDINKPKLRKLLKEHPNKDYARALALNITKLERSYTKYSDHYHSKHIKMPYWASNKSHTITIGNHKFYKLK